jgi:hypothetical protein
LEEWESGVHIPVTFEVATDRELYSCIVVNIQAVERRRPDLYPKLEVLWARIHRRGWWVVLWSTRLTVLQSQLTMSRVGQSARVIDMFVEDADHAAAEVSGAGAGLTGPSNDFIGKKRILSSFVHRDLRPSHHLIGYTSESIITCLFDLQRTIANSIK